MPIFEVEGRTYEVDEDGFLQEPERWSHEVAKDFASSEAIADLTGIAPMIRKLCKETGHKLNEIYKLFPSGPAKGACKLAGLPKPTGCV